MDGEKFRNNIKKQVIILKFFKDRILKIIIINQNEIKNKNTWKNFVQIYSQIYEPTKICEYSVNRNTI